MNVKLHDIPIGRMMDDAQNFCLYSNFSTENVVEKAKWYLEQVKQTLFSIRPITVYVRGQEAC